MTAPLTITGTAYLIGFAQGAPPSRPDVGKDKPEAQVMVTP